MSWTLVTHHTHDYSSAIPALFPHLSFPRSLSPRKRGAGIHYYEEGARAMVVTVLPLTPARTWYQARTITHGASIAETAWCGASVRG